MIQYCLSDVDMLQMDVFNTFIELLRQTGNVTKGQTDANETRQVASVFPCVKVLCIQFCFFICFDVGNFMRWVLVHTLCTLLGLFKS
jgi:hypothetical protein